MPATLTPAQIRAAHRLGEALAELMAASVEAAVADLPRPEPCSHETAVPEGLLNHQDAGARLGVSERTVKRLVVSGALEKVRVGRRALITSTSVATYIDALAGRPGESNIRRFGARRGGRTAEKTKRARRSL